MPFSHLLDESKQSKVLLTMFASQTVGFKIIQCSWLTIYPSKKKKKSKNWYFSMQYLYQFIMAPFLKVATCSFFKDQKRTKKTMTNSDQRFQTVSFHLFPSFHLLLGANWEKYIVNKICNKAYFFLQLSWKF